MKEREIELGQQAATAIPPSVTQAHAASKAKTRSEVEVDQPKDCWRRKPIRIQLLVAYGSLSLIAFGTLLGVSAYITSSTADSASPHAQQKSVNPTKCAARRRVCCCAVNAAFCATGRGGSGATPGNDDDRRITSGRSSLPRRRALGSESI